MDDYRTAVEAAKLKSLLDHLKAADWVVTRAAETMGISKQMVHGLMRQFGVKRPAKS